ncbi:MAG: hypothetical protein AAF138_02185 [Planctomycetota bacterium]
MKSKMTAAIAALTLVAGAAAAQNLLSNAGFETPDASAGDIPGAPPSWGGFNDPGTQNTTQQISLSGAQSFKTFGPFDFIGGGTGIFQAVPATPGETYTGRVFAQNFSGDAIQGDSFGVFKLEFLDAGGGLVGGTPLLGVNVFESAPINASSPQDQWLELGTGGIAPAGTALVQAVLVQVQLGDGAGNFVGGAIFWDDAFVAVPAPATAAFLGLGGLAAVRRRR